MEVKIKYESFVESLLIHYNILWVPTSEWYTKLCTYYNNAFDKELFTPKEGADDFYTALGVRLADGSMFWAAETKTATHYSIVNKFFRLFSKSDILLDQYLPLYNKLKEDIKSVESRTISKFNDTPSSQGKYTADEYTTNITQVTNSVDYDIAVQIDYLKQKMLNLIDKYCDQFEEFKIWTN